MAFAFLASAIQTGQTGGTTSAINTTGATLLVASVSQFAGAGSTVATVSDSKGNTWTPLTVRDAGDAGHRFFYVATPTVGTGHTVTVAGTSIYTVTTVYAFSGATAAPFDVETGAVTTAASPLATGSVTPSQPSVLIVSGWAGMNTAINPTVGSALTQTTSQNAAFGVCISGGAGYLVQNTAAAINPTWTWTGTDHVVAAVAVFRLVAPTPPLVAVVTRAPAGLSSAIDTTGATLLVVSAGAVGAAPTISDSKSNTWIALTTHVGSAGYQRLFYCFSPTVGPGHTFTLAGSFASMVVYAFSGIVSYQTESGHAVGSNSPPVASGSVTPSSHGALILTGMASTDAATDAVSPGGFTQTTVPNVAGVSLQHAAAYDVQPTAAAINPTWTWTGGSHAYAAVGTAVFLPAAAPAVETAQPYVWGPL